jgi:hypothetical protein
MPRSLVRVSRVTLPGIDVAVTRTPPNGSPSLFVTRPRITSVWARSGVATPASPSKRHPTTTAASMSRRRIVAGSGVVRVRATLGDTAASMGVGCGTVK